MHDDHPLALEACLRLRSLTIVVLKTRVVRSALIALGTDARPPLDRHFSQFDERLEISPL